MLWRESCAAGPREFDLTLTEFASAHTCAGLAGDVLGLRVCRPATAQAVAAAAAARAAAGGANLTVKRYTNNFP
jgi:hypothetical protein